MLTEIHVLWMMVVVSALMGTAVVGAFGWGFISIWFVNEWEYKYGRAIGMLVSGTMVSGGLSLWVWSYVQYMDILIR